MQRIPFILTLTFELQQLSAYPPPKSYGQVTCRNRFIMHNGQFTEPRQS